MKRHFYLIGMIAVVLIIAMACTACKGSQTEDNSAPSATTDPRPHVEAVFSPAEEIDATDEQIDAVKAIIETRVDAYHIPDCEITSDYKNDSIIVRFPWDENDTDLDPAKFIEEISVAGELTFRDPNLEIVMDGSSVEKATAGVNSTTDEYVVNLVFTSEGTRQFAEITEEYLNQQLFIYMDETVLAGPTIQSPITDGNAQISGNFDAESATKLANQINGGALPFALKGTYNVLK